MSLAKIEFLLSFTFLRFDGIHQGSAGSSNYSHRLTIGMANYLGKALTTGCNNDPECYTKTELMDMYTLTWSRGPDFPLSAFQTSVTLFTVQIHFTTLVQTYKLFSGESILTLLHPHHKQLISLVARKLQKSSPNSEMIPGA